jgi:predicted transcriptional regulator
MYIRCATSSSGSDHFFCVEVTMMNLQQIREALADRRLDKVSEGTGVHPITLARIRDGKVDPKSSTLEALSSYFEARR